MAIEKSAGLALFVRSRPGTDAASGGLGVRPCAYIEYVSDPSRILMQCCEAMVSRNSEGAFVFLIVIDSCNKCTMDLIYTLVLESLHNLRRINGRITCRYLLDVSDPARNPIWLDVASRRKPNRACR